MKVVIENLKETDRTDIKKEFCCSDCGIYEIQDECCISIGCPECGKEIEEYQYVRGERFFNKENGKSVWVFLQE